MTPEQLQLQQLMAKATAPKDTTATVVREAVVSMNEASVIVRRLTKDLTTPFQELEHGAKIVVTTYASAYNANGGTLNAIGFGFVREMVNAMDNGARHYINGVVENINAIVAAPTVRNLLEGKTPTGKTPKKMKKKAA